MKAITSYFIRSQICLKYSRLRRSFLVFAVFLMELIVLWALTLWTNIDLKRFHKNIISLSYYCYVCGAFNIEAFSRLLMTYGFS
jgi:hypothetical protein